jgi:ParB family transcriptional regulator, chromosome partitioning protein
MVDTNSGEFEVVLVPGSTKKAMGSAKAISRDFWHPLLSEIHVMPGFNAREDNEETKAHIRKLADSMKAEGFYPHAALAGYVRKEKVAVIEDGKEVMVDVDKIYITDGHCRLKAALLAVSEGAEIERLPVVPAAGGVSLEDLTVALVKTNGGKPLAPYEVGVVCKRLSRFGWDAEQIAKRLDFGVAYVEGLLLLVASPANVRDMVRNGIVSAANAIAALKAHGDKAYEHLSAAMERAKSTGATKVTAKHLPGALFKKQVKKTAPVMFEVLQSVKTDPGYKHVSQELREKIDELVKQLEEAKAEKADESSKASSEEGAE